MVAMSYFICIISKERNGEGKKNDECYYVQYKRISVSTLTLHVILGISYFMFFIDVRIGPDI